MGDWKEVVMSGTLFKASDLKQPKLLTVMSAGIEEIGQKKERKLVLRFMEDEGEQGCVMNQERGYAMEDIAGTDDFEQWIGRKVVLYQGQTRFGGKPVACVAIRAPKNQPAPVEEPPMQDMDEDEIPF